MTTKKIGQLGSKKSFSVVLWLLAIFLVLYFFKKLMGGLSYLFGGKSDSEKETENQINNDIQKTIEPTALKMYSKHLTSMKRDDIKAIANGMQQAMNKSWTDWAYLYNSIKNMNVYDMYCLYYEFGARRNEEFTNMVGDLFDWVIREDELSIDLRRKPYVKAFATKYLLLSTLLKQTNKLQSLK